jgi:hypothetical protein
MASQQEDSGLLVQSDKDINLWPELLSGAVFLLGEHFSGDGKERGQSEEHAY